MSETLEKRIKRMGKNPDTKITAYASDISEILGDKERRIEDAEKIIQALQKALSSARKLLEDKYDYEAHCDCSYSGSGGTVSQCEFHGLSSVAWGLNFEYEKYWKHFHRG